MTGLATLTSTRARVKARRDDTVLNEHVDTPLIRQYRQGSQDAAEKIYEKYSRRVNGYIRKSMSQEVHRHDETCDLAQWVFADLFRTMREADETLDLDGRLWTLIGTIAQRVVCDRARYWSAQCRDTRREQEYSELEEAATASKITPALLATMKDLMQSLVASFEQPQRRILALLLEGHRTSQVSQLLGISDRTVRRTRRAAETVMHRYFEQSSL